LACFEPMQTFYEDEAITIRPNKDGHLLSDFQHTLGDLLNNLWFERCAAFYRHVDVRDRKLFSPHHCTSPKECQQYATKGNNLSLRDAFSPSRSEPIRHRRSARNPKRPPSGLPTHLSSELFARAKVVRLPAGRVLFREGD